MSRAARLVGAITGLAMSFGAAQASVQMVILGFEELSGWEEDDHAAALSVFQDTCIDIKSAEWANICAFATSNPDPKNFFELFFKPVLIEGPDPALFTGYFEPELTGSRTRDETYKYPIYRKPLDIVAGTPWNTRAEIERLGLLDGKGLEIAFLADPVDVFFLQIQGSGRVKLTDGTAIRVGYGGKNGQEYKSVGAELVKRGIFQPHEVSAAVIRNWVQENPVQGTELLQTNPSFVFFREVNEVPPHKGPLGAMNRSITQMRSIAVDPEFVTLGAPVWIEKAGAQPLNRLMIAQDTGSAIKGPQRADIFFGTGEAAGLEAGNIKDTGRMVVLMPIQAAYALADSE